MVTRVSFWGPTFSDVKRESARQSEIPQTVVSGKQYIGC